MKKAKIVQPKHLKIFLEVPNEPTQSHFLQKTLNSSLASIAFTQDNINIEKQNKNKIPGTRDVIRLGSKKKWLEKEQRQNKVRLTLEKQQIQLSIKSKKELQVRLKPQRKNSLTKYFKNSKQLHSETSYSNLNPQNVLKQTGNYLKNNNKLKAEIPEKQSRNVGAYEGLIKKMQNFSRQNSRSMSRNCSKKSLRSSGHSKERSLSLNKKLLSKQDLSTNKVVLNMQKIKQLKFVSQYLTDFELQGILNELEITGIPQVKWPLIVVDKVYQFIRKKDWNDPKDQIIRTF